MVIGKLYEFDSDRIFLLCVIIQMEKIYEYTHPSKPAPFLLDSNYPIFRRNRQRRGAS